MFVSEDSRRRLIEWIANEPFVTAKVVIAKSAAPIGDHYHLHKNEKFLLLTGKALKIVVGDDEIENIDAPHLIDVPKGSYHRFELMPGSILLGVGDKAHDPNDEIRK